MSRDRARSFRGSGCARGAAVTIDCQSHEGDARRLAEESIGAGSRAIPVKADASRGDDGGALFARAMEAFGAVGILAADSGLQRDASSAGVAPADWRKVIDVDLIGQLPCA